MLRWENQSSLLKSNYSSEGELAEWSVFNENNEEVQLGNFHLAQLLKDVEEGE